MQELFWWRQCSDWYSLPPPPPPPSWDLDPSHYLFGDNSTSNIHNQPTFFVKAEALSGHPVKERVDV